MTTEILYSFNKYTIHSISRWFGTSGALARRRQKKKMTAAVFLFYLVIDGKASLESFILQPIRENNCISFAVNDIIIIYLCRNTTEL